jgi:hypothetical protein
LYGAIQHPIEFTNAFTTPGVLDFFFSVIQNQGPTGNMDTPSTNQSEPVTEREGEGLSVGGDISSGTQVEKARQSTEKVQKTKSKKMKNSTKKCGKSKAKKAKEVVESESEDSDSSSDSESESDVSTSDTEGDYET